MNYRVIGERIMPNRWAETSEVDKHESTFTSYTDALDYYISTFGSLAEDICDLGGEFVITLVADAEEHPEVLKRHVISTTILK